MFLQDLDTLDKRDLMTLDNTKWIRVSQEVMRAGFSACKTKWNQLIPKYKKITDYLGKTGRSVPEYWKLWKEERKAEGLPKLFFEEFFHTIHE